MKVGTFSNRMREKERMVENEKKMNIQIMLSFKDLEDSSGVTFYTPNHLLLT